MKKKYFSLIELLIVIAIIAILGGILINALEETKNKNLENKQKETSQVERMVKLSSIISEKEITTSEDVPIRKYIVYYTVSVYPRQCEDFYHKDCFIFYKGDTVSISIIREWLSEKHKGRHISLTKLQPAAAHEVP